MSLGEHGMVIGEIYFSEEHTKVVKYKFLKMDTTEFVTKKLDISEYASVSEVLDKLEFR